MSWIMTKRGSQDNIITYEHYCDTFSDLSNIPSSQVTLGSTAVVINDEDNGLGIYMANSQKEWVPISTSIGGGSGEITLDLIHICSSEEYNSSTKVPTIEDAEVNKIYLVPNNSNGNNLFDEWIYADDAWEKIGGWNINIPVSDVQVNGTSIVSNGVANMPLANNNIAGLIYGGSNGYGIRTVQGVVCINPATDTDIKAATENYKPIAPARQDKVTFYGLAKAAGDSTQSESSNAVGTYTDEAKAAIQQMLDVPSNSDMSTYATKTDTVLETTLSMGRKENTTVGEGSFAFGSSVEASGSASHAEGAFTVASGIGAHAEGTRTIASGSYSHAENGINASGYDTIASGDFSHAEGGATLAAGRAAHSEGWKTKANGMYAHTEGLNTISNGKSSHAAGKYNIEDSYISWPEWTASTEYEVGAKVKVTTTIDNETTITGYICKTANTDTEFTASKWTEDAHMNYAHIVGNGTADNARSNAYALDWDGNGHYAGDVYVGCNNDSTGGTKLPTDVQVNGVSVVNNGVANVPVADSNTLGVIKLGGSFYKDANNALKLDYAGSAAVKSGSTLEKAIVPYFQDHSAFYGLAKAAGADMASLSSTTVGTYPDAQKAAIQHMLGTDTTLADYEADTTADQAYAIGELFMLNGKLHQATAVIATGDTFTVGTNCAIVNAADVFPHDVKVNGTSVVTSGVANIQKATDSHFGVVKTNQTYGIWSNNGVIQLVKPGISSIKAGTDQYMPIYVDSQHSSTFYGLAKAAGADMASSSNAVGTYTDTAKTAICSMIGAVSSNQGAVNAGKVLGIGNDGSVSPVSAGSSSTLYGLQDTNFVQLDLMPGDALTYTYALDGSWTWSNVPLMYSCSIAESDFGGSTTYTYLDLPHRHYQDASDLEFYLEQGSRIAVYDSNEASYPILFNIGYMCLNDGEEDANGQVLFEVWFIDMTQGSNPLVVRKFRKTYIQEEEHYYYVEVT